MSSEAKSNHCFVEGRRFIQREMSPSHAKILINIEELGISNVAITIDHRKVAATALEMFIIFFVLSFAVAGFHLYRDKQQRTGRRIAEILLLWLLLIYVGLGGIWAFIGHTLFAEQVAESIGWPAGNSFQTEVAISNLAVGTLGVLWYWLRGSFWTATVIATSIWLLDAATIHVVEIVAVGNYNPGNAGWVFYLDILNPLLLVTLLIYTR